MLLCVVMTFSVLLTSCNEDSGDGQKETQTTEATNKPSASGGEDGTKEELVVKDPKEARIEDWVPITDYGVDGGAADFTNNYEFR